MSKPLILWVIFTGIVVGSGYGVMGINGIWVSLFLVMLVFFAIGFIGQRNIKSRGLISMEWKLATTTAFYKEWKELADEANPHTRILQNEKHDDQMTLLVIAQDIEDIYQRCYFSAAKKGEEWNTKQSFGRSAAQIIKEVGKDTPRGKYLLQLGGYIIDQEY